MKKLFMFTAIAVLSMNLTFAQDDSSDSSGIHFGVKGGVNFSSLSGDGLEDFDGRTGYHFGAVVNIGLSEKFFIQPEVLYSTQGNVYKESGEKATVNLNYINVPIMAGYQIVDGLIVQAGPQIGFNIVAKITDNNSDEETDVDDVKTIDFGMGFGAQYKIDFGLFFQARYTLGLSNIIEENIFEVNRKNRVISLSVGYFFN
jgi:hypothetical protein